MQNKKGFIQIFIIAAIAIAGLFAIGAGALQFGTPDSCIKTPNDPSCLCGVDSEKRVSNRLFQDIYYCELIEKAVDLDNSEQIANFATAAVTSVYPQCNAAACGFDGGNWQYSTVEEPHENTINRYVKAYCRDSSGTTFSSVLIDLDTGEVNDASVRCSDLPKADASNPTFTINPKAYSFPVVADVKRVSDSSVRYLFADELVCPLSSGTGASKQVYNAPEGLNIQSIKINGLSSWDSYQVISIDGNTATYEVSSTCDGRGAAAGATFRSTHELEVQFDIAQICKINQVGFSVRFATEQVKYCESASTPSRILTCQNGVGQEYLKVAKCVEQSDGIYYRALGDSARDPLIKMSE